MPNGGITNRVPSFSLPAKYSTSQTGFSSLSHGGDRGHEQASIACNLASIFNGLSLLLCGQCGLKQYASQLG